MSRFPVVNDYLTLMKRLKASKNPEAKARLRREINSRLGVMTAEARREAKQLTTPEDYDNFVRLLS